MSGRGAGSLDERDTRPKGFDDFELTLGDLMRGERATKGKSLLDVQRELKVRAEYIAGIEDCDLSAFDSPGFIAGYVRAYARYLDMNPDWVHARFCAESGFSHLSGLGAEVKTRRRTERGAGRDGPARKHVGDAVLARSPLSAAPRPGPFHGLQAGAIGSLAVLAMLVAGLGYGGWSLLQEIQKVTLAPVETPLTAASLPEEETSVDEGGLGVNNTAPTLAALERLYRPQALDAPVMVPRDAPIATLDPDANGVFASRRSAPAIALDAPPEPPRPDVAEPPTPVVVEARPPEVVLFARRPAWVRVRATDGTVLLEKIMEQGERFVLPETEEPPTLRAGNSGSVFFAVNGETFGPAGPGTSVAKNVVLSAASLAETYGPADIEADPELARIAELVIAPDGPGGEQAATPDR